MLTHERIVKMATRPTIFKWRQTEPALILCAVRWYLRYSLSLRDVEELLDHLHAARAAESYFFRTANVQLVLAGPENESV